MIDGKSADEILEVAAQNAMPRVSAVVMAYGEKGNAVSLERAADTMDALADDIKEAAAYLRSIARKKRAEAEKVLNRN